MNHRSRSPVVCGSAIGLVLVTLYGMLNFTPVVLLPPPVDDEPPPVPELPPPVPPSTRETLPQPINTKRRTIECRMRAPGKEARTMPASASRSIAEVRPQWRLPVREDDSEWWHRDEGEATRAASWVGAHRDERPG